MYAFLQGELSAEDRERFARRFLTTADGRRGAAFAEALLGSVSKGAGARRTAPAPPAATALRRRWLPLAAAAVLMAAVGWLATQAVMLRRENARLRADQVASA